MSDPLEFIQPKDRYKGDVPLSLAVKAGKLLFVSGVPAFDGQGKLAIGDFPAQMRQVMENIAAILDASGTDWTRVVRTRVLLTRQQDLAPMNRAFDFNRERASSPKIRVASRKLAVTSDAARIRWSSQKMMITVNAIISTVRLPKNKATTAHIKMLAAR